MSRVIQFSIVAAVVALFCARNLPWHLDNYDQAKQAYTSFEMIENGHWLYQHTPDGDVATKPPLAGWISAAFYKATRWWDGSWRFPSLAAALAILVLLWRAGERLLPGWGGVLAACAFGLNSFAPRLATLARTDMLLTFFIFAMGWIVFEKLRAGEPWTARDRWLLFAMTLGSMMTKGPIAYAFLLPGLVAMAWFARPFKMPGGWWPWFAPLLVFLAWAGAGAWQSREFYEQVVLHEFLGRFTVGERAVHTNQPIYYYIGRLLANFAPWSFALIALACVREVRVAFKKRPELLWLACWAIGGLVFMSLIPSKRADRIFPVIPPFALLMVGLLSEYRAPIRKLAWAGIALGFLFGGGYAIYGIVDNHRTGQGGLVAFGNRVRSDRLAIVGRRDEGMLLYLRKLRFVKAGDAAEAWRRGEIDAVVLDEKSYENESDEFRPFVLRDSTPEIADKGSRYFYLTRQ